MLRTYEKKICFIIAFFMLISGVCLGSVNADSYFLCKTVSSNDSYISNLDSEFINNTSCTTEMLGVNNAARIIQAVRRIGSRFDIRTSVYLVCAELSLHKTSDFFAVEDNIDIPQIYWRTAILNYIHNKDGKK